MTKIDGMGYLTDNAMKYIDAERLRKEVRRLEKAAHKSALGCADSETRRFHEGKDFAYQYVGALIDSLQQEQPDFPTTDEQMKEFLATHPKVEVPEKYKTPDWMFEKSEKTISQNKELEEEIDRYFEPLHPVDIQEEPFTQMDKCARHFAQWGAEHLKK